MDNLTIEQIKNLPDVKTLIKSIIDTYDGLGEGIKCYIPKYNPKGDDTDEEADLEEEA
jgi:hypothetical protein